DPVQRSVSAPTPNVTPSAPESVQRMPETWPQPAPPPVVSSEPPQATIQRTPAPSAAMPTSTTPVSSPALPQPAITPAPFSPTPSAPEQIQRTPLERGDSVATTQDAPEIDVAPFRPINRYRDPRVLSRSIETTQPLIWADLPLTRSEPSAVLPQAR